MALACFAIGVELTHRETLIAHQVQLDRLPLLADGAQKLQPGLLFHSLIAGIDCVCIGALRSAEHATEAIRVVRGDHADEARDEELVDKRVLE